ncbi:PMCA-type calcium-translocating P-type ATPase [Sporodiniella umbellata]|nr:PMCA-type calcium-translocating P-type ATPase [Sporodiniella umbellata]
MSTIKEDTPITKTDSVSVEMRDHLTTPHADPHNPFAFTADQLSALQDPKNIELLHAYGGLQGIAKGLHTNAKEGLSPAQSIQSHISISDITHDKALIKPPASASQPADIVEDGKPFHQRRALFGENVLPVVKGKNLFQLMWMAFNDKTLILLAVAAIVSLAVGLYEDIAQPEYDTQGNKIPGVKWVEGVAIIVAIVIVVTVGSVNDFQKERQFRKLNAKKEDREVKATRDNNTVFISIYDIQVGDVLHLEPGDIVATDGIFIEGHNVRCDESAATGESDAVRKQTYESCYQAHLEETGNSQFLTVPSAHNRSSISSSSTAEKPKHTEHHKSLPDPFIISGSKVLEGVCTYLVTSVGVHSYFGRTMMALRTENESTPLQEKLNKMAGMIAKLGSAAGILMLITLLIRYFAGWKYGVPGSATTIVANIMDIVIVVVTIVVVAVPEGLPLAVTLALAYATQRMLKDNNLVRVLAACETMGNATTVCSDKTGTLTQNKMTVVAGTLGSSFRFLQSPPEDRVDLYDITTIADKIPSPVLSLVHQSIAINSTAFETTDENGQRALVGNKTETALLQFAKNSGLTRFQELRDQWPVVQVFPFSSERKAMATVAQIKLSSGKTVYRAHVKGASEILVQHCSNLLSLNSRHYVQDDESLNNENKVRTMSTEDRNRIDRIIQSYATRSLRTIGIAYRDFEQWPPKKASSGDEVPYEDVIGNGELTLIGVVGIEDPLRPGVKEAVEACQKAGVFVRMVTGDNVVTAKSIAKQCGIYTSGGVVMEGPVFRNLPPSEMDAILPRLQVLARSSPEDKQILVGRLRELGDIVAVTGDGTNDGPALKLADVGFSMGITGTEVAKEASSIILMDDNFASIVKAIMWGRCVNDSVKKFLEFQITVNITAVILTFVSAVASTKQKSVLTAVQLLWVNLIMDTFAALALATDPPTKELLDRPPEARSSPLITFKMWKMIIGQSIFQIVVTVVLLYSDILHYSSDDPALQTIVFNTFVFCQIFNEINCRRIDSHFNIFHNVLANKFFLFIFFLCIGLQVIIVNFGGTAFQVQRIDGIAWAISICIGLVSLPIGVVIRLIPDEFFGFVFFFNPVARQRYLGKSQDSPPTMYVAGNDRIVWNSTFKHVQHGIQSFKQPSDVPKYTEKQSIAASVVLPSMVATAPSTGLIPDHQTGNFEDQNQDTVLSSVSVEQHPI